MTEFTIVSRPSAPPRQPASAISPDPEASGPFAKHRDPLGIIGLSLVTLGLYYSYWMWKTTQEIDVYTEGRARSHVVGKWAALLGPASLLAIVYSAVSGLRAAIAEVEATGTLVDVDGGLSPLVLLPLLFAAGILNWVALWRVWRFVQSEEKQRGLGQPLSPPLLLALMLIPYVNGIGWFYGLHRTQSGLNRIWRSV